MKADLEFLYAISSKLQEISDNCACLDTQNELQDFINAIDQTIENMQNTIND